MAMAPMVTVVRPMRSASQPPSTAPSAPATPIIRKAASRGAAGRMGPSAAVRKMASQVHTA